MKPCLLPVVSPTWCSSLAAWVRPALLAVDTAVCCAAAWSASKMTGTTDHQYAALPRLQEVQEEELQRQRELVQQARAQLKEEAAVKATPPARQQPSMAIRCGARGITSRQGANG